MSPGLSYRHLCNLLTKALGVVTMAFAAPDMRLSQSQANMPGKLISIQQTVLLSGVEYVLASLGANSDIYIPEL